MFSVQIFFSLRVREGTNAENLSANTLEKNFSIIFLPDSPRREYKKFLCEFYLGDNYDKFSVFISSLTVRDEKENLKIYQYYPLLWEEKIHQYTHYYRRKKTYIFFSLIAGRRQNVFFQEKIMIHFHFFFNISDSPEEVKKTTFGLQGESDRY